MTDQANQAVEEQDAPEGAQAEDIVEADDQSDEAQQTDEDQPAGDDFEEIVYNGESKRLTKAELRELAQKGFDYTQKTQSIAQERDLVRREREAVAFQARAAQELAIYKARVDMIDAELQQIAQVDTVALARSNRDALHELEAREKQLEKLRAANVQGYNLTNQRINEQARQVQEERKAREISRLVEKMPELADGNKAEAFNRDAHRLLADAYGVSAKDVNNVLNLTDHRTFQMLKDLMEYRRIKTSAPKGRPITNAPPPPAKVAGNSSSAPVNPDKLPMEQWVKWRNKQVARKR